MSDFTELTYGATQVVCEEPRLIINPLLPELIAKYHTYYLRGRIYHDYRVHQHYFDFKFSPFSIKRNGITRADISTSFVVDNVTGETFPIYIEVPCNNCYVCKERKISSFVQRCKLETQLYDCKPWFVTLTYDNEHLPSDGVSVDEAQRYMKRLRINLVRAGFNKRIRYVLVGEYGKPPREVKKGVWTIGHRPHYHLILWNIGASSHQEYLKLVDILDKSWSRGFIQHRIINPENDKAFYYTAKYLKKDCAVPNGCNPTFVLSSRGHGGLGAKFLDGIAPTLRHTLNVSFKYLNKWSNKLEELIFSQYVLNRIFPSWSKSVPSVLRSSLADFALNYSLLVQRDPTNLFLHSLKMKFNEYKSFFAGDCYFAFVPFRDISFNVIKDIGDPVQNCEIAGSVIDKYFKKINFQTCKELADKRNLFVSKLFEHTQPVDIGFRAFRSHRNFSMSRASLVI